MKTVDICTSEGRGGGAVVVNKWIEESDDVQLLGHAWLGSEHFYRVWAGDRAIADIPPECLVNIRQIGST